MKCLCITGLDTADIEPIASILERAGMLRPKPSRRDESVSIGYWHEGVIAQRLEITSDSDEGLPADLGDSPGKFWEQLASDIFTANVKSRVWGWADPHSATLLDFWLRFEPSLNFILVTTTPERTLANAVMGKSDPDLVDALVEEWLDRHEVMLRFYHRNPQRCLLIDADESAANPVALLERCNMLWKLRLATEQLPVSSSNCEPLAEFLVSRFAAMNPRIDPLRRELAATRVSLGVMKRDSAPASDVGMLITNYRRLRDRSSEAAQIDGLHRRIAVLEEALNRTMQETEALHQQNINQAEKYQHVRHEAEQNLQASERANAELILQMDSSRTALNEELDATLFQVNEVCHENELLQLQVHQVQDELEYIFKENLSLRKQVQTLSERWQRMLDKNPEYFEYESLDVLSLATPAASNRCSWLVKNLSIAGRTFSEFRFGTLLEDGLVGLLFNRQSAGGLLRWPAAAVHDEILLIPGGMPDVLRSRQELLASLGTRDWRMLRALVKMLKGALARPAFLHAAGHLNLEALSQGLAACDDALSHFPEVFRYDQLDLKREQVNHDYEHLWLGVENVTTGGDSWPAFEFRLSCAEVTPSKFGNFPKLEFPEKVSQAPFDSWFVEAYDDFGAKLELRYALPNSMDTAVWNRLSLHDRNFVLALVAALPGMLKHLRISGVELQRSWDDWYAMACELLRITQLVLLPAAAAQPHEDARANTSLPKIPDKRAGRKSVKGRKSR